MSSETASGPPEVLSPEILGAKPKSSQEYTSTSQRLLIDGIVAQLAETGTVDNEKMESLERNLFVESATALLMAEAQDYSNPDLIKVLENLKALHMAIIVTFMPYPAYHALGRKWIGQYFKENQVYSSWLDTQEAGAEELCLSSSVQRAFQPPAMQQRQRANTFGKHSPLMLLQAG